MTRKLPAQGHLWHLATAYMILSLCSWTARSRILPFDDNWRFSLADPPGAQQPQFDDSDWRIVDTPHDWSIEDLPPARGHLQDRPTIDLSRGTWRFRPGDDTAWKEPDLDDSNWLEVQTPANWEDHGQSRQDNVYGWYRRRFDIPQQAKGKDIIIELGAIDDCDQTFVNGQLVGQTGSFPPDYNSAWDSPRSYRVSADLLKADGTDLIAIRVFDAGGNGGLNAATRPAIRIGPFDTRASQGRAFTGWVVGGTGWYRKFFTVEQTVQRLEIIFDGVYMDSEVWLNGHQIGSHPYGYTAFVMDLTPHLIRDGQNLLAVRVRNEGRNSRWYSGSGIFRHVFLRTTGLVYIPTWGLFVRTHSATKERALLEVDLELENADQRPVDATVSLRFVGPSGRTAAKGQLKVTLAPNQLQTLKYPGTINIIRPHLWSPESPSLYTLVAQVMVGGNVTDEYQTTFGIRTIQVDAVNGLRINGIPIELRGGCMHHDNGPLGAAAIDRAEYRRVELMKAAGFNAIRTSHNPPSSVFLDACDRLGMLVMDEAFDQWQRQKNPQDYHRFFDQWWQSDIASMVRRDRNHPSVIIWSIGNEVVERDQPSGILLAKELTKAVKALDPTRPVTEAINPSSRPWSAMDEHFEQLDICGYNYNWRQYEPDHKRCPNRIMVGTESFPMEAFENWQQVLSHSYVIGDFVWTGYDYLGESGIGRNWIEGKDPGGFTANWPWHIAGCGDIDILGRRKPQSFYREALWRPGVLYLAVHRPLEEGQRERVSRWGWPEMASHWTWPGWEGKPLSVEVYSSCDSVRLELNGRDLGLRPTGWANRCKAQFEVPYQPGQLKAIGTIDRRQLQFILQTAGEPKALRLKADRTRISASRNDLSFVDIEVVDAKGRIVPYAQMPVTVEVNGAGELAAIGNGNPVDADSFKGPTRHAWQGRLQAIVRPTGRPGTIRLTARADGLAPARISLVAR